MIQLTHVSKTYRSGRGYVEAISDVTFSVETGAKAAVMGKSGSGKTTMLYCIGGLERPDTGEVNCFGTNIFTLSPKTLGKFQRQQLGFVFQYGNLISYLTVYENILFPLILNGKGGKERNGRADSLLERIGLEKAKKALPHELSGGETQRISVARAIAHSPRLLLADEPTASLDSTTGKQLIELMLSMGEESACTMIIATHDPDICTQVDKTIEVEDGIVRQ